MKQTLSILAFLFVAAASPVQAASDEIAYDFNNLDHKADMVCIAALSLARDVATLNV